jgi:hypothetical protein
MIADFFFWGFIWVAIWADFHFNILLVNWCWTTLLAPSTYGWIVLLFLISLIVEDQDRLIWPIPTLYMYVAWHYKEFLLNTGVFTTISNNWVTFLIYFATYVVAGFAWSILKLRMYVLDNVTEHYRFPVNLKTNQEKAIHILEYHKGRIWGWIAYWPISLINFISYDMLLRLYKFLFNNLFNKVYLFVINKTLQSIFPEEKNIPDQDDADDDEQGTSCERARSLSPKPIKKRN